MLTPLELKRLDRYKIQEKKQEFTLSRGLLRLLLSAYLKREPSKLEFPVSPDGKPYLQDSSISFNISHSGGLFLAGFSLFQNMGVDVQEVYPITARPQVIQSYFSDAEKEYLEKRPGGLDAFFSLWTAKESYLKARGKGFRLSSKDFSALPEGTSPESYMIYYRSECVQGWSIAALEVGVGYKAAVAAEGQVREIQLSYLQPVSIPGGE